MNIQDMHYDVKFKLNKVDSEQYRNLKIPEIDWAINEAYDIFVKTHAFPKNNNGLGFEINERLRQDLRTILIDSFEITPTTIDTNTYSAALPSNYAFYVTAYTSISKDSCEDVKARCFEQQYDDLFKESYFDSSSFEWREVNITFEGNNIRIYTDGTFTVGKMFLTYLRKHAYIHNAQNFLPATQYRLPSGTLLTGVQHCELPEHTHREIVDLAVLILSGNLDMANYQLKQQKLNLINLKT
jgi:hypothetical protein